MSHWTMITEAHTALRDVVAGVGDDAWDAATPCSEWTVTQVLRHAAGDQRAYAAAITGGEGPAENPFAPSESITGDKAEFLAGALDASAAAWATIGHHVESVAVPVPPNSLPPETGAAMCALDALVHAWDIAVATGQAPPVTDEAAAALLPLVGPVVEPLRAFAFAPVVAGDDGGAAEELLRFLGRDPGWKPEA